MHNFILICNNDQESFINEVKGYLNKGYKLCGFHMIDTLIRYKFSYNQAMYFDGVEDKKEEPTENKQGSCQNCGNGPFSSSICMKKFCNSSNPTSPYYLANYVPKTTEKKRKKYIILEVGDETVPGLTEYYYSAIGKFNICHKKYVITNDHALHRQAVED